MLHFQLIPSNYAGFELSGLPPVVFLHVKSFPILSNLFSADSLELCSFSIHGQFFRDLLVWKHACRFAPDRYHCPSCRLTVGKVIPADFICFPTVSFELCRVFMNHAGRGKKTKKHLEICLKSAGLEKPIGFCRSHCKPSGILVVSEILHYREWRSPPASGDNTHSGKGRRESFSCQDREMTKKQGGHSGI